MKLPGGHYLTGFAISSNQARAVVITGTKTKTKPVKLQAKRWFLIYLQAQTVVILKQGSAVGLPNSDLAIGNRVLDKLIVGGIPSAVCLENDRVHLWRAQGGRNQGIRCYRLSNTGVSTVFNGRHGFTSARPTIIANLSICWVANGTKIKYFRRDSSIPQAIPLAAIIQQLCQQVGLSIDDIDVSRLTAQVIGFSIAQDTSVRSALETLRKAYFLRWWK